MQPVPSLCGLTKIVYVPATGSVAVSYQPLVPMHDEEPVSELPSGLRIWPVAPQKPDPIELFVNCADTRCPARPLNVRSATSPGFEIVTVTAGPPGLIVPVTVPATDRSRPRPAVRLPSGTKAVAGHATTGLRAGVGSGAGAPP